MTEALTTERLFLRPFVLEDAPRLFLLDSNADVMKYIGMKPLEKVEESEEIIKMIQRQYAENSIGRFAVIEKSSQLLIGWSGLKLLTEEINGYKNVYDLGFRFLPEFWGKGYAKESASAFLKYAFNQLNLENIYAHAHSENQASNNALQKLGFQKTGEFLEEDGMCYWYEISKKTSNFKL